MPNDTDTKAVEVADGPSVQRRQLGRWLQNLRESRGWTQSHVAKQRHWETSKISRIETGRSGVHPSDLMVLMDIYEITDEAVREDMVELAEQARSEKGGFISANDVKLRPGGYLGFERDATAITEWQPNIVPGLLQTDRYAMALFESGMPQASPEEREARVQIRLDRQRRLDDTHPPVFTAILDESVLHRQIGGPETHLEQLQYLQDRLGQPHISLQIMPLTVPNSPLAWGHATLLEFANSPDLNLVYLEGIAGDYYATKKKDFARYRKMIETVAELALPPDASRDQLTEIISKYSAATEER